MGSLKSYIKNHLILALDITNLRKAIDIAVSCAPYLDAIKIGLPTVVYCGLKIIKRLKTLVDLPIIADFKIADICYIAKKNVQAAFKAGADAITVWGFVGPTTIEMCLEEANRERDVIILTELTHSDAKFFMQPVAENIVRMAKELEVSGIQAPGTRPQRIRKFREIVGKDMLILACGIGVQGGEYGTALMAGADFEIVGRAIYMEPNPSQAAQRISNMLKAGILSRK